MNWDLGTAARTVFQEARGEPLIGQKAVAHVINNRLKSGRWGHSLASVCLWHAAFSGWFSPRTVHGTAFRDPNFAAACSLPDSDPSLVAFAALIQAALDGEDDSTGGATHYYAQYMPAPPAWTVGATLCGQFGNQIFYKDVP